MYIRTRVFVTRLWSIQNVLWRYTTIKQTSQSPYSLKSSFHKVYEGLTFNSIFNFLLVFYHKDLKQHDEKLQTIFNTILKEFHKYSNCKTFSVQLKQCNKNRMVANILKNTLQEYLKTQSVNIKVLRVISCQQQPINSIRKCFQSRK